MRAFWKAVYDHLKAGEPVALVTVAASKGSVPRGAGARMAVFANGSATGSVGGGAVEHAARAFAQETVAGGARLKRYGLTRDDAAGLGMICGGDVTLLFQPLLPGLGAAEAVSEAVCAALAERRPCWLAQEVLPDGRALMGLYGKDGLLAGDRLDPEPALAARPILETGARIRFTDPVSRAGRALIFGGGHVSRALTPILAGVGFSVFVYDDRPEFADIARFPGADGAAVVDFSDLKREVNVTPDDFAVIVTRGHQADYEVLRQVLPAGAAYLGMIGSRAKVRATLDRLCDDGYDPEEIARVCAPIGLPIGAQTPEEIAVSIAAEMILRRSQLR